MTVPVLMDVFDTNITMHGRLDGMCVTGVKMEYVSSVPLIIM